MTSFDSADESAHYAFSVGILLQQYRRPLGWERDGVVEMGTGDATAVADVVRAFPTLRITSFDISAPSVDRARENLAARGVADRYAVELGDFFAAASSDARLPAATVIANPPYLPAPDDDLRMPELWGGERGNDVARQLLDAGYDNVVVTVPSYSDPRGTVQAATDLGYRVVNFVAMGLDLGDYSRERKVLERIDQLRAEGRAWTEDGGYVVAVVLFSRNPDLPGDRAAALLRALQLRS